MPWSIVRPVIEKKKTGELSGGIKLARRLQIYGGGQGATPSSEHTNEVP